MSLSRVLVSLAIVSALLATLHGYVWARLVRSAGLPDPWGAVLARAFLVLAVVMVAAIVSQRFMPRAVTTVLAWVGFTWLGVLFFLVILLLGIEPLRLVARVASALGSGPSDPERRLFVGRAFAAVAGLGALGLGVVSSVNALRKVRVKEVRVALAKLPPHLAGYRIVQLSDIHIGPTIGRAFLADVVARTNALGADLVVITGDLVDGSVHELAAHVAPLKDLRAKDGVFFVTGNHEYYSGVDAWLSHLATLGVRVLRNERVAIAGGRIDLAGIDDWTAHGFGPGHGADLPRALEGRDPSRPCILLAHQPKAVLEASALGVDLQLSGHTHGGQLFPFNYLVPLAQPYVAGLHTHGAAQIYVSEGTGYWGPAMRLGAPAEITHLELGLA